MLLLILKFVQNDELELNTRKNAIEIYKGKGNFNIVGKICTTT